MFMEEQWSFYEQVSVDASNRGTGFRNFHRLAPLGRFVLLAFPDGRCNGLNENIRFYRFI